MARLTSTVNINLGGALEALSFFGIPNPVDWLSDADGDPEAIQQRTTAFIEAAQTMSDCADELKAGQQNLSWSGSAADVFGDILGAIWEGFKACVEFILWIPEIVLQIVDWILDLFRWVLNLVILVCTTICAIYVALCAVIAALSAPASVLPEFPLPLPRPGPPPGRQPRPVGSAPSGATP
jgi:hypothetical protein